MDPDAFKIQLNRIGSKGLDLDLTIGPEDLRAILGAEGPYRASEEGRLKVHLERVEGNVVHVRGRAQLGVQAPCSRCLNKVDLGFDAPVEIAIFPVGSEPPAAPDGELQERDMGVATHDGQTVELGALLRDEIFLELPMSPLCRENCAGLCARCGVDLNQEQCSCELSPSNEAWSALRDIKLN